MLTRLGLQPPLPEERMKHERRFPNASRPERARHHCTKHVVCGNVSPRRIRIILPRQAYLAARQGIKFRHHPPRPKLTYASGARGQEPGQAPGQFPGGPGRRRPERGQFPGSPGEAPWRPWGGPREAPGSPGRPPGGRNWHTSGRFLLSQGTPGREGTGGT